MEVVSLIRKKREGEALSKGEINFIIERYVRGEIPDYQISALLMAIYFRGLSPAETGYLTHSMIHSGDVLDLSSVEGPFIDKHSTGGVGDKVSLILAPLVASSGVRVPMMSGRSLGHTGGTLDKLESIPGYRTALSPSEFIQGLAEIGYSMTGQSERVVPADRMLYALRDVTATVESIPLITASILSKKFAEGAEGLVFDVKSGSGAFMKTRKAAEDLAESLVRAGKSLGKKVAAVITDMDQPLGRYVGNFLEVKEAADCLQGRGPVDLMEVTLRLAARMLIMGGVCGQIAEAEEKCLEHISCGAAWDRFIKNVEFQGGDVSVVLNPDRGPKAAIISPYVSSVSGYVRRIDAFKIGMAATVLGAGRMNKDEAVLPAVGIELEKKQGDAVKPEEVLSLIHAETQESLEIALEYLSGAYQFSRTPVSVHSLILDELGS